MKQLVLLLSIGNYLIEIFDYYNLALFKIKCNYTFSLNKGCAIAHIPHHNGMDSSVNAVGNRLHSGIQHFINSFLY